MQYSIYTIVSKKLWPDSEVVAALLKAGADIGLVDKSVKAFDAFLLLSTGRHSSSRPVLLVGYLGNLISWFCET